MKYSAEFHLTAGEVWCPNCGAAPNDPCTNKKGPLVKPHVQRAKEAKTLTANAQGNEPSARWWRWRLRKVGPPRPPMPHGTHAGYERHKREGTVACAQCREAARIYWRKCAADSKARKDAAKAVEVADV